MATTTEQSAGAGGKFRKRPTKRAQSTPYDRPSSALRPSQQLLNSGGGGSNGWFSKIVDPASRLITAGAHKLFSSVFRKRILPPPQQQQQQQQQQHSSSPDEVMEAGDVQPEVTSVVAPSGTKESVVNRGDNRRVSENGGVAELEGYLKQKTFTRSEIDHLTALLLSRTADDSAGAQMGGSEHKSLDEKVVHSRHEMLSTLPAFDNGAGRVSSAAISTPDVRSKVFEDAVASPAELAKAYMGSRPTRASPSVTGMQNGMAREDLSAQYSSFVKPRTPATSLIQKSFNENLASANGFLTPRFRGKSGIYNMARTPYSRPQTPEVYKAAETASDVHGASSLARNASEAQQFGVSKRQVLKRRSSVLESDMGFVGPIRRIRQKPNLLHQKTLSLPASGGSFVKHGYGALTNVTEAPSSFDWSSNHRSSSKPVAENGMPSTSNGYVPSQSIEMAQKIFQQLEKFTPKGKSPEKKLDIAGESSSGLVTSDMKDGLSHKSVTTEDSSKVFKTFNDGRKANGFLVSSVHDHTHKMSPKGEEDFSKKFVKPSVDDGLKAGSPNNALDDVAPKPSIDHRQKKWAFQMSAHEDYLELDDDVQTNVVSSTLAIKGVEGQELPKSSAAFTGNLPQSAAVSAGKSSVTESKSSTFSFGSSKEDFQPDGSSASPKFSSFSFSAEPSSPAARMSSQAAVITPQSTAEREKVSVQSEGTNVIITFGSNSGKMAPLSYSTSSSIVEFAAPKNTKPESLSSAIDVVANKDGPEKIDKNTLLFGEVSKKMGDAPSEGSSAKGSFSFGLASNGATLGNGLSSTVSVTTGLSSPAHISSSSNDLNPVHVSVPSPSLFSFSNGSAVSTSTSTLAASSGSVISNATTDSMANLDSSSQLSTSMTGPTVSLGSTFQFASSAVPSTSASVVTSASESAAISGAKSNPFAFGNATGNLFSAKPSGTAKFGNETSSFNAPTFKTFGSESQSAASSVTNGSIFGLQASSSAVPVSTSVPSFSSQSTSSASSNAFGLNTPTSFNASTSIFGSSTSVANPFASGSSASSALGSSLVTEPISSSSNAASSVFGWQSSKPTVPGSLFSTSFQSTGFSVGSTASGSSAAGNSTPIVFGAISSSSGATNSAPFVFGSTPTGASIFSAPSAPSNSPFPSQSTFGSSTNQTFPFSSTPPVGNNDRMNMEDSMAEDSVQVSTPTAPVFGVPNPAPSTGFAFGATAPSAGSPFQFGGQQSQIAPQSTPFQPSGSVEFNAGGAGSFSLGSAGGDKANRRIVKVKKGIRRK